MIDVISTIISVFGYVLIGFFLKKLNIFPNKFYNIFSKISFNFLLPVALIVNFWLISFPDFFLVKLLISFFGSGILIFILAFIFSNKFYRYNLDDCALMGLSACFGNSVALGIPLVYSILGPIDAAPYMILVLFHGIIHFTYTTFIIEYYRNWKKSNLKKIFSVIIGMSQNLVLAGMFIGLGLNYFNVHLNQSLLKIFMPIANIALPTVLISMGIGLATFNISSKFSSILLLTILKNFIQPLIAFIIAKYIFILPNLYVFIITLAAALPSGTQTYYFSYRYNSLQNIISTNVLISTFVSIFTLSILLVLFGY